MQETHIDELTALPNHLFFNQLLNKALSHAKRHNEKLALLFIDIDNFSKINEEYGFDNSNLALQELGRRLKTALRIEDTIARLENDEFAVLLADIHHPKMLGSVIDKLLECSVYPIEVNSKIIKLTISIGIAIFPEDGQALEALQKNADIALHRAKHAGGANYQFFTPQMKLEAQDYLYLQKSLRQALDNNEFILYFQPKLSLKDKTIVGVEALVRWEHPQHGIINPATFIPIAEETDFIIPLGEWILREACHTNKRWQNEGYEPIAMSVNLSPEQFHHPHLSTLIESILKETQLDPHYLDLEITEMTVMDDISRINEFIRYLRGKGISFSIDDFGTGHTSVRYLKDFPINILKIDQSFIKPLPQDQSNAHITCNMILMAHELGIKVVAEGVETIEQLDFLAQNNCDMAQGYFISRPLPASKIVAFFKK